MTFADALMLLFELADKEDSRFQPVAARWHARFVLAADLPLRDSEMVMNLLCGIRGANRSGAACVPRWPRSETWRECPRRSERNTTLLTSGSSAG